MSDQSIRSILDHFICTVNSCCSQMAEGRARRLNSAATEHYSAVIETHELNTDVVKVMAEAGIDISDYLS